MAKLQPIEKVSGINEQYIIQSMKQHYSAAQTSEMTPLFIKTLVHDYKMKAKNLAWLFGDDTTITIHPEVEKVLADLIRDDAPGIRILTDYLKSVGATYTAEQLQNSKCTYKKQEMRVSRVIQMTSEDLDIIKAVISGDKYEGEIHRTDLDMSALFPVDNTLGVSIIDPTSRHVRQSTDVTDGGVVWVRRADGLYDCFSPDQAKFRVKKNIHRINIEDTLSQIDAGTVVLSIDLNDFITASSGGVSSCFGFGGMHHLGWMNYWRSDFGIMVFMQNKQNRYSKVGRQWLLMRMTENGRDFDAPVFKFQKPYGRIKLSHTRLVEEFIFKKIKEKWGYNKSDFDYITNGNLTATEVSDNCMAEGGSHGRHSGYTDSAFSSAAPGYALKENKAYKGQYTAFPKLISTQYQDGRSLIFNFPDAMNMKGIVTNSGNFQGNQTHRSKTSLGYIPPAHIVTCAATGKEVLDKECTMMPDGTYVLTEVLIKAFNPEAIPEIQEDTGYVEPEAVIEELIITEEELAFDVDEF